ncbi:MAG: beta-ketoacyl synthase chain length factor [Bacteroidetes bacterium]|nr:beta-ketoacyl synthase chain length factor [Bacteroidota bacterium]
MGCYIHQNNCVSPQGNSESIDLNKLHLSENNTLKAIEPDWLPKEIPLAMYRRMGKASRLACGAALPLLKQQHFNGVLVGTGYGGLEDCVKFLSQIIEYNEGRLTPTHFVQSTSNAIASQLAFFSGNKGHNCTHTHRGLAFENALLEALMLLKENEEHNYLLGGVDEISTYQHNIDFLTGWHKEELVSNAHLFSTSSKGSLAGEGAAFFTVNNQKEKALAYVKGVYTFHSACADDLSSFLKETLQKQLHEVDILLSGACGDNRFAAFYQIIENILPAHTVIIRYKHLCGEYATSSSFALWLACYILQTQKIPTGMIKKGEPKQAYKNILIHNTFRGKQHSFIWLQTPNLTTL